MGAEPEALRADIERRREEMGQTLDAIGDRVSPGRIIERRKNRMNDGIHSARERIMGVMSDSSTMVSDATSSAADSVRDTPDAVRAQTAGHPLTAGLVSFGLGFLVAAAFPKSEAEARAAQKLVEKVEPVKDELMSAGREIAEDLKQGATEAGQQVKETATEAASSVSDTTKQEAGAAREEMRPAGSAAPTI